MDKYKTIKLGDKQQPGGAHDTIVKMYRNDKKMMKKKDLDFILTELNTKNKSKKFSYLIRGRNKLRMSTLKGFEQKGYLDYDDDYYQGNDAGEFDRFYYLEVTLRKIVNLIK